MTHSADTTPDASPSSTTAPRERLLDLSMSQTVGGSLAAATAAALGSRLGVVGTITGAALVSVISAVAAAVYTTSLRRTGSGMATAVRGLAPRRSPVAGTSLGSGSGRRMLAGAGAVFAIAAMAVTGLELTSGQSLTGGSGSTTVAEVSRATDRSGSAPEPDGGGPASAPTDQPAPSEPEGTDDPAGSAEDPAAPEPSEEPAPLDSEADL